MESTADQYGKSDSPIFNENIDKEKLVYVDFYLGLSVGNIFAQKDIQEELPNFTWSHDRTKTLLVDLPKRR